MDALKKNRLIAQIVLGGWLAGWYLKVFFYCPYLLRTAYEFPVAYPLFPEFFLDPNVSAVGYFLPLSAWAALCFPRWRIYCFTSTLLVICSIFMLLHINTYNDATFVTSFWVALWLLWFSTQMDRTDESVRIHGRKLAQGIVGIIFLGGIVGKITPGYWNGEVIYNIFWDAERTPIYAILSTCPEQMRPLAAMVISRMIIIGEAVMALAPVLSYRATVLFAGIIFTVMTLFSTWRILSVHGSIIGMLLGCLLWETRSRVRKYSAKEFLKNS